MNIITIDKEDCCVYKLSQIAKLGIDRVMLSAVLGRVFVVGENDYYCGTFSVDSCDTFNKIDNLRQIPIITSSGDLSDPSVERRAKEIYLEKDSFKYGILPVVNNSHKLLGGVSRTDNRGIHDKIACLAKTQYYKDKNIPLEALFATQGYKRVAFWGLDELSLAFANEMRHFESVELLGIYENKMRQKYIYVDFLNYEVDVNFVDSISDVMDMNVDLIIVTDWTMRNIVKHTFFKGKNNIIYLADLLEKLLANSYTNSSYINSIIEYNYKNEVQEHGVEMLIIRVPTEGDMKIPRKAPDFTVEDKFKWLGKEGGWERDSAELKEFNQDRRDFIKKIKKDNGLIYYADFQSSKLNYINKGRVVLNAPKEYDNIVYLIGPCIVSCQYHTDLNSFGYYVQEQLLKHNLKYKVVAFGMPNDADRYYWVELLKRQNFKSGDKIILFDQTFRMREWDLDLLPIFLEMFKEYGNDFYYDIPIHCGRAAFKAIAEFLCDYMKQRPMSYDSLPVQSFTPPRVMKKQPFSGNPQLKKYQEFIQSSAIHKMPKIGSIVMNCNPFTLGHRYLIEYAAERVDYLYIFVVEEDKSYFKFEDRIELVKAGTGHLRNVKVLPSGQFIISSTTFSEYFDKANLKGTTIDTSLDVETFGSQIAPCLNISVRFVGEEPLDPITAQYNQSMKEILPRYGIELCEIPRKEDESGVISASRVRKCLDEKKWDEIKMLVPETTYVFLEEKFG